MKVTILHSETTRVIEGPFQICGSHEDLLRIATLLIQACHSRAGIDSEGEVRESTLGYGWVSIFDPPPEQGSSGRRNRQDGTNDSLDTN